MSRRPGTVFLIGAGPGHPGLITVLGRSLLRAADVVAYDRLVLPELVAGARRGAELRFVGKVLGDGGCSQNELNSFLIQRAKAGKMVVRLKGGDPFVFGRGAEEVEACKKAGVECYVIPGVTSATSVPASAGISLTDRRFSHSFVVLTAASGEKGTIPDHDWSSLSRVDTMVVLMGRGNLLEVVTRLLAAGRSPDWPVACIESGTTSEQKVIRGTLATIVDDANRNNLRAPSVAVFGTVAAHASNDYPKCLGPLAGKRIMLTRPRSSNRQLNDCLVGAGAVVTPVPVIRIRYAIDAPELDAAVRNLHLYQWIAFGSVHAVIAFHKRLNAASLDARALAPCRIAVLGPATARQVQRIGIQPDLQPSKSSGLALADGIVERLRGIKARVLHPCSDIALSRFSDQLRRLGVAVDDVVAYHTIEVDRSFALHRALKRRIDMIVFHSPSAVRSFGRMLERVRGNRWGDDWQIPPVACIGSTTAEAGRAAGMNVCVAPERPTDHALTDCIIDFFERRRD